MNLPQSVGGDSRVGSEWPDLLSTFLFSHRVNNLYDLDIAQQYNQCGYGNADNAWWF